MHFRVLLSVFCVLMYAGLVQASPFAYLANNRDMTVSVLDTANNQVATPIPVGQEPYGVAVNQQGSRAYVSNQLSKTISVIDTALLPYTGLINPVIATIQLVNTPGGLAVNAAGTRLFVALNDAAKVDVYSTLTNTRIASVPVGSLPEGIAAVQASGAYKVVVTNTGANGVSVINADDSVNSYVKSADYPVTGFGPTGVAVTSDGQFAYVACTNNKVSKISLTNGIETPLPAATLNGPFGVAITSDNAKLYVANNGYNASNSTVTVYDLTAVPNPTETSISLGNINLDPKGISIAPSGKIYTANNTANSVSILNANGTLDPAGPVAVRTAPVSLGKFIGPLLHPIGVTVNGYGYIYPAGSLISLNVAGNTALAADGKDITLGIIPDHNFAISSLSVTDSRVNSGTPQTFASPAIIPTSYTFSAVNSDINSISASFVRTYYDLKVTKNLYSPSEGTGTVTTSVGNINCGITDLTCGQIASIPVGASVTITAIANSADGSEFMNWSGGFCSGNSPTCVITAMNSDLIIDAHFIKKSTGPVRRGRPAQGYGQTLEAAYADPATGTPFTLDLLTLNNGSPFTMTGGFNLAKDVTLVGGWTDWTTAPDGALPAGSATTIQADAATGLVISLGSVTIGSYNGNGAIIVK